MVWTQGENGHYKLNPMERVRSSGRGITSGGPYLRPPSGVDDGTPRDSVEGGGRTPGEPWKIGSLA